MMNRRSFNKLLGLAGTMSFMPLDFFMKDPEFGHNSKKYTWDKNWTLHFEDTNQKVKVKDCHEMVCLPNGEMILLTNHPDNNLIRFDQTGKILSASCQNFPGAHGLSLGFENDQPFLIITDTDLHKVFYTDLQGNIKREISAPLNLGYYESAKEFVPTETVVAKNGDLYIADGYGKQFIIHLDKNGKIIKVFGGKGAEDKNLGNAHGICIDYRSSTPTLIITDRNKCCFKRFTMGGDYISTIPVPGANVCRPVIKGDYLYAAVLTTNTTSNANTGYVVILDKNDQLISCVGGSTPSYNDKNVLLPSYQTVKLFQHPHDVMVDHDHNLYVCQWNSGQVLPYKFIPV